MHIGIEGQRLFRKKKHGMDIVALEVIRKLQTIDKTNQYFIFVKPDEDKHCLQETANFKIVEVPGNNYLVWEQVSLVKYIRNYNLDLLHCTSNTAPLFCPVPLLLTLHDVIFLEKVPTNDTATRYQKLGRWYRKWIVPFVVNKCRKIITVSHAEKKCIVEKLRLPESAVEVVYNGVSERFNTHLPPGLISEVSKEYSFPDKFFFFLGNSDPKKNMVNVVLAFAQFAEKKHDIYLVMADIAENVVKEILSSVNKTYLLSRFVFTGYIHPDKLPVFYSKALAFLYPSLRESFGLPILEAMACGTPVITSNTSAMPEIAGGGALLVNPNEVSSITEAMEISLNPENTKLLITKGFAQASNFSWLSTAHQLLKLYETVNLRQET